MIIELYVEDANMTPEQILYHNAAALRIQIVLDELDDQFAPNGIVRTILRQRIQQEKRRAEGIEDDFT